MFNGNVTDCTRLIGKKFKIRPVGSAQDLAKIVLIRGEVFVEEQKVPLSEEFDHFDTLEAVRAGDVVHLMALDESKIIGTGRLILKKDPTENSHLARIGRIAVVKELRRKSIGSALMTKLHEMAFDLGFSGVILSAQLQAEIFYLNLGYKKQGDVYDDVGIAHQDMVYKFLQS